MSVLEQNQGLENILGLWNLQYYMSPWSCGQMIAIMCQLLASLHLEEHLKQRGPGWDFDSLRHVRIVFFFYVCKGGTLAWNILCIGVITTVNARKGGWPTWLLWPLCMVQKRTEKVSDKCLTCGTHGQVREAFVAELEGSSVWFFSPCSVMPDTWVNTGWNTSFFNVSQCTWATSFAHVICLIRDGFAASVCNSWYIWALPAGTLDEKWWIGPGKAPGSSRIDPVKDLQWVD